MAVRRALVCAAVVSRCDALAPLQAEECARGCARIRLFLASLWKPYFVSENGDLTWTNQSKRQAKQRDEIVNITIQSLLCYHYTMRQKFC